MLLGARKEDKCSDIASEQREHNFIFFWHTGLLALNFLAPDWCFHSLLNFQIRIWKKGEANARKVIGIHDRAVTDISLHPTGEYFLSTSDDAYWSLVDLHAERPIIKVGFSIRKPFRNWKEWKFSVRLNLEKRMLAFVAVNSTLMGWYLEQAQRIRPWRFGWAAIKCVKCSDRLSEWIMLEPIMNHCFENVQVNMQERRRWEVF